MNSGVATNSIVSNNIKIDNVVADTSCGSSLQPKTYDKGDSVEIGDSSGTKKELKLSDLNKITSEIKADKVAAKVQSRIDSYKEEAILLQGGLSAIPALSPTNGGEGEAKKAQFLISYLEKIGFDEIKDYNCLDTSVPSGYRPNFTAKIKGERNDKTIWIVSHLDVVPPGELKLWNSDPYKIKVEGDKIYGRGVEDNQQGVVSSILSVKALKEEKITPKYDVALMFVSDEETGSQFGIQHVLKEAPNLFKKQDIIIIPDGGNENGTMIEVAEKSVLWAKFTVLGKQCHASMPNSGINANRASSHLVVKLDSLPELFSEYDPIFDTPCSTFEPTKKEGNGASTNTIPGEDIFHLDCRVMPKYDLNNVIDKIGQLSKEVEEQFKVKVSCDFTEKRQAAPPTPVDTPVVKALKESIKEVYGVEAKPMGIGGGTIAAYLRDQGYPCAVWAKVDESAHQPNEYSKISNILGDAKVFANIFLH